MDTTFLRARRMCANISLAGARGAEVALSCLQPAETEEDRPPQQLSAAASAPEGGARSGRRLGLRRWRPGARRPGLRRPLTRIPASLPPRPCAKMAADGLHENETLASLKSEAESLKGN